jgi:hypothetical protein
MLCATDSVTLNGSACGAGLQLTVSNTARRGPLIYVTSKVFNPRAIKAYISYTTIQNSLTILDKERNLRTFISYFTFRLGNLYCLIPWYSTEHLDQSGQVL